MSSRFVDVPASAIRQRLEGAGFLLLPTGSGEEVYERAHDRDPRYTIKVYSSIRRGEIRGCGADAIRVVALLTIPTSPTGNLLDRIGKSKVYPIFKSARVYRTGTVEAVLERMIERAREAYATCGAHRRRMRNVESK